MLLTSMRASNGLADPAGNLPRNDGLADLVDNGGTHALHVVGAELLVELQVTHAACRMVSRVARR